MMNEVLSVVDLSTRFFTENQQINAVESVSFDIQEGEILGIVGESGSGKSVTARSIIGLIESPGQITDGEIWYRNAEIASQVAEYDSSLVDGDQINIRALGESKYKHVLRSIFSIIFQDPSNSFNPTFTVGEQIAEAVEVKRRLEAGTLVTERGIEYGLLDILLGSVVPSKRFISEESREQAVSLLEMVNIPDPELRAQEYPHEFSGGMLQRAMIAQALASEPDVLIADEPTTGLDVTIEAQVLALLDDLQKETDMTIMLITHDLGVVSRMCDRVGVMYAGEMVERGSKDDIFQNPAHPYTQGLLGSIPDLKDTSPRLQPIDGHIPDLVDETLPTGCYFADRCPEAMEKCKKKPPEFEITQEHGAKCYLVEEEEHDE